ncbi:MAG: phosphatase PAP2 family protein [Actinomycetota bacterium]
MTVTGGGDAAVPVRRRLPGARVLSDNAVIYWWGEILLALGFYFVYSAVRNAKFGGATEAFRNAQSLIDVQRFLGIYHEEWLQDLALRVKPLIIGANYFYGSLHFVVTIGVMVFLFACWPDDYPYWRNTLAIATALALIGFTFWPLMPPRLLPASYGYVDTLARYPTFWSFNSGAVNKISNQYAAMPSVHCCWALWCACVLVPRVRHRWAKGLAIAYPVATVTVIVLTGNHYFLDAVGGFTVLGLGFVIARRVTRAGRGARPSPRFGA